MFIVGTLLVNKLTKASLRRDSLSSVVWSGLATVMSQDNIALSAQGSSHFLKSGVPSLEGTNLLVGNDGKSRATALVAGVVSYVE